MNKVIEKIKDKILYFKIEGFSEEKKIKHLFSSRIGWNLENIFKDLSNIFEIPENQIYRVKQVHGVDVLLINKTMNNLDISELQYDGLVTNEKGIALCTSHADCVPIYYYDPIKEAVGVAHAGWKGTLNNINKNIIDSMKLNFNTNPSDLIVAIGPSISVLEYEIGKDVEKLFVDKYPDYKNILFYKNEKIYLDLWEVNRLNLLNLGVPKENINESRFCTASNTDKLYSYRKENGIKARMIAAISLKK